MVMVWRCDGDGMRCDGDGCGDVMVMDMEM